MRFWLVAVFAALSACGVRAEVTFNINTADLGPAYPLATSQDVDDFAEMPVAWPAWETVRAIKPDGTVATVSPDVSGECWATFTPDASGLWSLSNVVSHAAVRVGIGWPLFGGGLFYTSTASEPYELDCLLPGPDRKGKTNQFPPTAYSGDNWFGDSSKAATLTFVPPEGSGLADTTLNLTGTGARSFAFGCSGRWTVRLEMADGTVQEACINAVGGFTVVFR